MKRLLIVLLAALPMWVHAAADDLFMNQRDHTNTNTLTKLLPATATDGIVGYIFRPETPANRVPWILTLGPGLAISNGVLDSVAATPTWASITGKPSFASVATSGLYSDLTGKPSLFSGAYADLSGIPATFTPSAHTQAFSTITATPTSCAGYGILDCVTPTTLSAILGSYATTSALSAGLAGKFNSPAGTTSQYVRGDGSLATLPAGNAGTVTSITAGAGLSGGTITTSGTVSMPNTGTPGTYATVTTDAQGRVTSGSTLTINDAPARSLVSSAIATGYQVSATRNAQVCYEGSFATTSTIGGPSGATVLLETADTNSTTATDWTTKAQQTYSNNITLAVVLNQVQSNNWSFCRYIPAGKYVRIRTANVTGTASVSINATQQEVLQ